MQKMKKFRCRLKTGRLRNPAVTVPLLKPVKRTNKERIKKFGNKMTNFITLHCVLIYVVKLSKRSALSNNNNASSTFSKMMSPSQKTFPNNSCDFVVSFLTSRAVVWIRIRTDPHSSQNLKITTTKMQGNLITIIIS